MTGHSDTLMNWLVEPPSLLVIGEGPYALAMSQILGAAFLEENEFMSGPSSDEDGRYPQVCRKLERVFLVTGSSHGPTDILTAHDKLWDWVQKLSPEGDQHELTVVFVLPPSGAHSLSSALAAGLALEQFGPDVSGHGVVCMGDPLEEILEVAGTIKPQDLPPLRARRAGDLRHAAIRALQSAGTDKDLFAAAKGVAAAFINQEYLLDLFCKRPCHQNGNQLRTWLKGIVTNGVTHDSMQEFTFRIQQILNTG